MQATVWTAQRNQELLQDMDSDKDGFIQSPEFVGFLQEDLPRPRPDFDAVVDEFLRIAKIARAEALAELERLRKLKEQMTAEQLQRVKALFVAMDADSSGEIEVNEIVIVQQDDQKMMLEYLDSDGNSSISMDEWVAWHEFVFANLPSRYSSYNQFLEILESLLEEWRIRKSQRETLSPRRTEWSRNRRSARTPRTPRTPRKKASKSLMNYTGHMDWILAVAVAKVDGKEFLITASQDMSAKVYNVESGELICTFNGHQGSVISISWVSADPQNVFTASLDGTVSHWNLMSGEEVSPQVNLMCQSSTP